MKGIKIVILIEFGIFIFLLFLFFIRITSNDFDSLIINRIIETFDHNEHVVYSNVRYISYKSLNSNLISNVEWLDDNHIIYSKKEDNNKNYYLIDSNENTSLLYSSNDSDEYGIIYKDSILYFISNDNTYNKYENDTLTKINKSDYYVARDGNKYTIDINYKNDSNIIESIAVKDNLNNTNDIIDRDLLLSNNLVKKIDEYSSVGFFNYYVFNGDLLIHIVTLGHSFLLKYDNGAIFYYDYNMDFNYKTSKCFFINDLEMPLLRYVRFN